MSVYKRGKYSVVQFNYNKKTFTRSSKSTRCCRRSKSAGICRCTVAMKISFLIAKIVTIDLEASRSFPRTLWTPP